MSSRTKKWGVLLLTFILLLTSSPLPSLKPEIPIALAANGYIDPSGDGSSGGWSHTGSAFYTEIDEGTRQPTTPSTSDNVSGSVNNAGSLNLRMTSLTSVSSVSQVVVWVYHNDGSNGLMSAQLYDDNESTTRSSSSNFPQRSSNTWDSVTFSGLSLTQGQLDTLTIRLSVSKSGGGPPATEVVSALYADVTYTPTVSVSISLTTDGSVSFGTQALNTTRDTTAGDLNDVETVSVDAGPADLVVNSTDWGNLDTTWSLAGSSGSNQVKWEFSPNGSSWTTFAVALTNYSLASSVAQGNTQNIYLRLTTPTSTSTYDLTSATATITASAP